MWWLSHYIGSGNGGIISSVSHSFFPPLFWFLEKKTSWGPGSEHPRQDRRDRPGVCIVVITSHTTGISAGSHGQTLVTRNESLSGQRNSCHVGGSTSAVTAEGIMEDTGNFFPCIMSLFEKTFWCTIVTFQWWQANNFHVPTEIFHVKSIVTQIWDPEPKTFVFYNMVIYPWSRWNFFRVSFCFPDTGKRTLSVFQETIPCYHLCL